MGKLTYCLTAEKYATNTVHIFSRECLNKNHGVMNDVTSVADLFSADFLRLIKLFSVDSVLLALMFYRRDT